MAEKIGTILGKWLYNKGKVEERQIDHIRYGFEILCSELLQIFIMIMYGVYTGRVYSTLLYVILCLLMRNAYQGYHAKTIWRCFCITIAVYYLAIRLYPEIRINLFFIAILSVVPTAIQINYCFLKKKWHSGLLSVLLYCIGIMLLPLHCEAFIQIVVIVNIIVSAGVLLEGKEEVL